MVGLLFLGVNVKSSSSNSPFFCGSTFKALTRIYFLSISSILIEFSLLTRNCPAWARICSCFDPCTQHCRLTRSDSSPLIQSFWLPPRSDKSVFDSLSNGIRYALILLLWDLLSSLHTILLDQYTLSPRSTLPASARLLAIPPSFMPSPLALSFSPLTAELEGFLGLVSSILVICLLEMVEMLALSWTRTSYTDLVMWLKIEIYSNHNR